MGVRRDGREAAVQYLYQRDLNEAAFSGGTDLQEFYQLRGLSPSARRFCDGLIKGYIRNSEAVDEEIRKNAQHFEFHRLSVVDRNILRIAAFELLHCADIPPVVSINEAIEIAKKYSTEDSGKFVNGILDKIRGDLNRPARTATPNP